MYVYILYLEVFSMFWFKSNTLGKKERKKTSFNSIFKLNIKVKMTDTKD